MKNYGILCLVLIMQIGIALASNQPEKIYSFTRRVKPQGWYAEQAQLWKAEVDKNTKNADAWLNYYTAVRMARLSSEKPDELHLPTLKSIVTEMGAAIPNSFEYNYSYYRDNDPIDAFPYLQKANEIDPSRIELLEEFALYYEYTGEQTQFEAFCKRWLQSNDISQNVLAWNYNQLMSVEPQGILLTGGDMDTEPTWLLQQAKDVRKDVQVLNIHMLKKPICRSRILKSLQMLDFNTVIDMNSNDWLVELCKHIIANAGNRPVYFTACLPTNIFTTFSKNLYLTGLAFKYSPQRFDNIAVIQRNIESQFLLDYLKVSFVEDPSAAVVASLDQNYLPAMLTLYQHYKEGEETAKAAALKNLMNTIAKSGDKQKELDQYLNAIEGETEGFTSYVKFDAKIFENVMMPIKGNLYARQTETTNEQYDLFLTDLLKQRDFDKLAICKITPINWLDSIPEGFPSKDPKVVFENGKPTDADAPIENISYEAAQAYCNWLTRVCNANPKKKFKKVLFRLPTAQEWEMAARAKEAEDAYYPWSTTYQLKYHQSPQSPTNTLGCYLANFNAFVKPIPSTNAKTTCHDNPAVDGVLFPAPVVSYWPNDFQLYCTIGNVAEMTCEKGIAKGGSWYHKPEDSTIKSVQHYTGPTPWLGIRVFMEVLEQ